MSNNGRQPPKRQAPPVPAPRNSKSETDASLERDRVLTNTSKVNVTGSKLAQMNQEILRYRTNLKEKLISKGSESSDNESDKERLATQNLESIKKELQDVIEKNTQWQMYNEQREEYVKDLIQKYNDLHHQFHHIHKAPNMMTSNPEKLSEQQRRHFDELVTQARQELKTSHEDVANLKSELQCMKSDFVEEKKKLQEEIDHWRAMYEQEKEFSDKLCQDREKSARCKQSSNSANKENRDRIISLQREMQVYREDVHCERKRREELEKRLDSIQKAMKGADVSNQKYRKHHSSSRTNAVQESRSQQLEHRDAVSPPKQKRITTRDEVVVKPQKERRSHPVDPVHVTTRVRRVKESRNRERTETSLGVSDRMNRTYHEFGHSEDSNLRCPNCSKVYGVDEHEFLLSHIDSCV